MHRWFLILAAVFILSDSGFGYLEHIQNGRDYLIALTISLVTAPWVVAQFDS